MKKQRAKFVSVPIDCGVKLDPGEFFEMSVDRPITPNHQQLAAWMMTLRGEIHSRAFGLENELVMLALANEFGTNDPGTAVPEYHTRESGYRAEHSFGAKVERAKPIIRAKTDQAVADNLIQQLADVRDTRNLIAHYAAWIEPVNDVGAKITTAVNLYIGNQSHIWLVDLEQARDWLDTIYAANRGVEIIRRKMIGAPGIETMGSEYLAPIDRSRG